MKPFTKLYTDFWTNYDNSEIVKLGVDGQLMALYLQGNSHHNMLGVYYLPVMYAASDLKISLKKVQTTLEKLCQASYCRYDNKTQYIWIYNAAVEQLGTDIDSKDNRIKAIHAVWESLPTQLEFLEEVYNRYKTVFHLKPRSLSSSLNSFNLSHSKISEQSEDIKSINLYGDSGGEVRTCPSKSSPLPKNVTTLFEAGNTYNLYPLIKSTNTNGWHGCSEIHIDGITYPLPLTNYSLDNNGNTSPSASPSKGAPSLGGSSSCGDRSPLEAPPKGLETTFESPSKALGSPSEGPSEPLRSNIEYRIKNIDYRNKKIEKRREIVEEKKEINQREALNTNIVAQARHGSSNLRELFAKNIFSLVPESEAQAMPEVIEVTDTADLKAAETMGFSKSVGEADTAETLPSNELQPLNSIQAIGISKSQAHKIIAQGAKDTAISETHAKLVSSNCNGDYKIEVSDPITAIFNHWRTVMDHPRANLDPKRKALIRKALQFGYSVEQLCEAITGCFRTPHNVGHNEQGQRYDGLHVILRDADQIDRFVHNCHHPPKLLNKEEQRLQSNIDVASKWVSEKFNESRGSNYV